MFTKHPIASGIALMVTCFVAFMTQASLQYEDQTYVHYQTYASVQEVEKSDKGKKKSVCAEKLQKQQKEIADKLKDIKRQLKKFKK
jgi:hypothetical protein|tara:strand:- start:40 stop:297 length:258 start_codon:yes stop_codon:yes gene_type:complete